MYVLEGLHDLYSIIAVRVEASHSESVTSFLPSVKKFGRSLGTALTKQLLIQLNSCAPPLHSAHRSDRAQRLIDPGHLPLCLEGKECRRSTRSLRRSNGSTKRSRASMLSVKSSPASSTNLRQPSVCSRAIARARRQGGRPQQKCRPRERRRLVQRDYEGAGALPPQNQLATAAAAKPQRSGSCPSNRQDAARNHRCVQGRSPEPCRCRDCPTQAGWPRRRARWEALCHTAEWDGVTRRGLRRDKKSVGRLPKEPVDAFASLRCRQGVPVCDVQAIIECRPSGGTSLEGPMARIHFLPPTSHTSPITATDRVPSDELHGKPGMSVDRGKRKYHHS